MSEQEESPAQLSAAPVRLKRKRGARFWIVLSSSVLFALPLIAFLFLWAYVEFGFLNSTIEQRLAKRLGTSAHVKAVRTDALQNLKIQEIAIASHGPGEPLTIGATKLDFGLIDLIRSNRLRGMTVDRPNIDLRYDPKTGWNHSLQMTNGPGEAVRINRVEVRNGTASIAWPGGTVRLAGFEGAFAESGPAGPEPFNLKGALSLDKLDMPPYTISVENENASISAETMGASADGKGFDARGVKLDLGRVGHASGDVQMSNQYTCLFLDKLNATIDLGALDAAFKPGLFGGSTALKGSAQFSNFKSTMRWDSPIFRADNEGLAAIHDARISLRDFGELPPLEASGEFTRTGVKGGSAKWGDFASLSFGLEFADVDFPLSLIAQDGLAVKYVRIDFERFFQTPAGQKMLGGSEETAAPFSVGGALAGKTIDMGWSPPYSRTGASTWRASGLRFQDIALVKLPPPFHAPKAAFSGPLSAEIDFEKGAPSTAAVAIDLSGTSNGPAPATSVFTLFKSPPPIPHAKLQAAFKCDAAGTWSLSAVESSELSVPLASLGKVLGLMENAGITLGGEFQAREIHFDAATGTASGKLHLENATLRYAMSPSVRRVAETAVTLVKGPQYAIGVQTVGDVGVKSIFGEFIFHASRDKVSIAGQTTPGKVFFQVPVYGDLESFDVPVVNIAINADIEPDGACGIKASVKSGGGELAAAIAASGGKWNGKATLSDKKHPGAELVFEGDYDAKDAVAGPFVLSAETIKPGAFVGEIRKLFARVEAFSVDSAKPLDVKASVDADFTDAAIAAGDFSARLSGRFAGDAILNDATLDLNAALALASFSLSAADGSFSLRGLESGIKLSATVPHAGASFGPDVMIRKAIFNSGFARFYSTGALKLQGLAMPEVHLKNLDCACDFAGLMRAIGSPGNKASGQNPEGMAGFVGELDWTPSEDLLLDGQLTFRGFSFRKLSVENQSVQVDRLKNGFAIHEIKLNAGGLPAWLGPVQATQLCSPAGAARVSVCLPAFLLPEFEFGDWFLEANAPGFDYLGAVPVEPFWNVTFAPVEGATGGWEVESAKPSRSLPTDR